MTGWYDLASSFTVSGIYAEHTVYCNDDGDVPLGFGYNGPNMPGWTVTALQLATREDGRKGLLIRVSNGTGESITVVGRMLCMQAEA